ncbi:HAMP domain-containing histidine kinase [Oceanispirochaeta crateris]|uniref:histidine kinase n=1 Tax=Oceanispirochaeta crateris TaxID=2518645 RepID=A0A5C1QPC7_9SPIO|nr:HAMP domain-containing sensor histidine kinase [Oceanispirochaeta crateris]QEN08424.1 HAMP domain-containing histidine kinase [Oceanispirochaeta crateris]
MRSMRARMLAAFFLIILLNSILLILSLLFGYSNSRKHWNDHVEHESRKLVMEFLTAMMDQEGILDATSSAEILKASRSYKIESAQIFLFSPGGDLLQSWSNPFQNRQDPEQADISKAEPLILGGQLKGSVQIVPLSFGSVNHNSIFITRIVKLFSLGLILSGSLSLLLAYRISAAFTKEAGSTARSLIKLARGSRLEQFSNSPTKELAKINEAAGSLQKMLIADESRRNLWSASIAHDLRTPLTAMKTQFSAYRDGALELTPEGWDKIMSELTVLESLTRDFLILGELDSAGKELSVKKETSDALRRKVLEALLDLAASRDISLKWTSTLDILFCDLSLISRALEALIKNAIQNMNSGGTVEIMATGTAESPCFKVINPGHIPEEHLPHLFDPLYKTDKSRKKEGSGLGLTISRRIAEFHRGSLVVENLEEQRVCFTMSLNLG